MYQMPLYRNTYQIYCRVPARWGLQQTARAATKGTNRIPDSPFLLRQGEPGTSQYIYLYIY